MNYDDLLQLKLSQEARYAEWQNALVQSAVHLREMMEKLLEPPAKNDGEGSEGGSGRYVEIVNIQGGNEPGSKKLAELKITDTGTLVFGISVGFRKSEEGVIGDYFYVPVAARFIKEKLHYQVFNPKDLEAEQWIDDPAEFCKVLYEEFVETLTFDPFVGPQPQRQIGFLKKFDV